MDNTDILKYIKYKVLKSHFRIKMDDFTQH